MSPPAGRSARRTTPDSGSPEPAAAAAGATLPERFARWFASRGWRPRAHQLALVDHVRARRSALLIAPTGAGKTLAGFLPSLIELTGERAAARGAGLHTLYISPLKALAVDVARNVLKPVEEMALAIRIETRTGDTPPGKRQRQRVRPPEILMTTPEQLALLIAHEDAGYMFADLRIVVLDELHALAASKRGDLLALGLARLRKLAPALSVVGLSATVARPSELAAFIVPQRAPDDAIALAEIVRAEGGARPDISILEVEGEGVPWAGHSARYAVRRIYEEIRRHRLSLLFVNTRSQCELLFQELWRVNEENLPIGLHHGSLDAGQRRKVEAAMAAGRLKAVVCTSTLDLGIDWGDVDLVVNVGAPKGASRLIQRIGRANHRLDEPSKALLVPSNRFEVLECRAALIAAHDGTQDAVLERTGGLDVLAQHVLGVACSAPFDPGELYGEVRTAAPYAGLTRDRFDRVVDLVATGGYALRAYERFARLRPTEEGRLRVANARIAQLHRMNVGTIVEAPLVKVRLVRARGALRHNRQGPSGRPGGRPEAPLAGGRVLGELDEWYVSELSVGDTFVFGGEVVRFEGLREMEAYVSRAMSADPKIPSYPGGKFPLSTHLAETVRAMLSDPDMWPALPVPVAEWLALQRLRSELPGREEVLVEVFPRGPRQFLVAYPFEGRLAHQTLGMLLTRRLERAGARPTGFVANDYGLSVWCAGDLAGLLRSGRLSMDALFDQDMLGDDLDAWLAGSSLMKRTFRMCATIAGLIQRRHPGMEKSGRQMTVSSDLIYDVLRRHDPGHVLLEAAWSDAATGLLDIRRLGGFLARISGRIRLCMLSGVSPLSVPILLEIGRESVPGSSGETALREAADALIREAVEGLGVAGRT